MSSALHSVEIEHLPLLHRGKVRDSFAVGDKEMLIVASDRLSAFDVVLPDAIPGKGAVLTQLANIWFRRFQSWLPNHLSDTPLETVLPDPTLRARLAQHAVVVKRLKPLPVEAVVRGYLIGSGWKDYQASGEVCGIPLAAGLRQAQQLPEPIFTPATKAAVGDHDENISFAQMAELIGAGRAEEVREVSLRVYREAYAFARERGIIIADTKLEFGLDENDQLVVMDEVLTPDSSRFWPAEQYEVGISPPSFDKQYVRDYLETLDWDKSAPGPRLPPEVIRVTAEKYAEAFDRLKD